VCGLALCLDCSLLFVSAPRNGTALALSIAVCEARLQCSNTAEREARGQGAVCEEGIKLSKFLMCLARVVGINTRVQGS
jgi:hypothetical protein